MKEFIKPEMEKIIIEGKNIVTITSSCGNNKSEEVCNNDYEV